MNYTSIQEVYAANDAIRDKFKQVVRSLPADKLHARPEGEKWSIAEIIEHVSMVNDGVVRICGKLLSKAEADGRLSNGTFSISNEFIESATGSIDVKLEAPEIVHPVGGASVEDSFGKLDTNHAALSALREKFEKFDGCDPKFPHPYFGNLSAQEWLTLSGGHELRHLRQIKRVIEKLG